MNKSVAISTAFPVQNTSFFIRLKVSAEYRVLGRILDPEHESNLGRLRALLDVGSKSEIRDSVSSYLTKAISRGDGPAGALFYRVCLFLGFLDRTVINEDVRGVLKFLFFKEAWPHLEKWRILTFPSPTKLRLCPGFVSRGRIFDATAGKDIAIVERPQGTLVLNNKFLGRGTFGSVKTGLLNRGHGVVETVAVKRIRLGTAWMSSYPAILSALNEALMPNLLGPHPNVMPVFDFYIYEDGKKKKDPTSKSRETGFEPKFAIVMPNAVSTGLSILSKDIRLKKAFFDLFEAALALSHIEKMGYVHNDFKLDNLLFCENGAVKLSDFGISYARGEEPRNQTLGGTYPSPEAVESKKFKYDGVDFSKIDTFSFGVILFDVLFYKMDPKWAFKDIPTDKWSHYQPDLKNGYLHDREAYDNVSKEMRVFPANPVVPFLSMARTYCEDLQSRFKSAKNRFVPDLADLVRDCLSLDPKDRPSMEDVVRRMMAIQKWVATT